MKKNIIFVLYVVLGFFMHEIVQIIVGATIKTKLLGYYKPSIKYLFAVGFLNCIPFLFITTIALTKKKVALSKIQVDQRNAGLTVAAIGVIVVNIVLHGNYWWQLYYGTATSTISLGIPLIPLIATLLAPLFYWFGKYVSKGR